MQKVHKAMFPLAGFGTRFLPATKAMLKELLPIVDKPLIQYAVEVARLKGRRFDCGSVRGYLDAIMHVAKQRER